MSSTKAADMDLADGLHSLSVSTHQNENCLPDQAPCPGAWPWSPPPTPTPFILAPSWNDPIEEQPDPSEGPNDSEHVSTLMQLPQEIRDIIFEHAFGTTSSVDNSTFTKRAKLDPLPWARPWYKLKLEGRELYANPLRIKLLPSIDLGSIFVSKQFFRDVLSICQPQNSMGMLTSGNFERRIWLYQKRETPSFLEATLTSLLANTRHLWVPQTCEYALKTIVLKRIFNAAPQLQRLTIVEEMPWQWVRAVSMQPAFLWKKPTARASSSIQVLSQIEVYAMMNAHELPKDLGSLLKSTLVSVPRTRSSEQRPLIPGLIPKHLKAARLCEHDEHLSRRCDCASDIPIPRQGVQIYRQLTIDCDVTDMIPIAQGRSTLQVRKKMLATFRFNIENYVKTGEVCSVEVEFVNYT